MEFLLNLKCSKNKLNYYSGEETVWIKDLVSHGFNFHHAKGDTAVLTRWLPTEESNGIPEYPSLYIGVGTITVNDKNEILVIKEKVRWYNNWKFPGGYVDKGENILAAAVRFWLQYMHFIIFSMIISTSEPVAVNF